MERREMNIHQKIALNIKIDKLNQKIELRRKKVQDYYNKIDLLNHEINTLENIKRKLWKPFLNY